MHVKADTLDRPRLRTPCLKTMRASSLVLGPLVARCGRARVSMPGGRRDWSATDRSARPCARAVGRADRAIARLRRGDRRGWAEEARARFERITVTGTEDVMMAAALARGETLVENAAREPEVEDLAHLLIKMGAQIDGAGTSTLRIRGVNKLHGASHSIISDRIEAGTFMIAGAITKGDLRVTGCVPKHVEALAVKMREAGIEVLELPESNEVRVRRANGRKLRSVDMTTEEFPGFATDLQAQYMALMTQAEGISFVTETIFENRFMHVQELVRMGANIRIEHQKAIVAGPSRLSGAQVICSDLRASASLVLAALVADGETLVDRVYHIDRGYETIEAKLASAGASILRKV